MEWAGSDVSRASLELQGLPFDFFSVVLHVLYFYFTVLGPLRWFAAYTRRLRTEGSELSSKFARIEGEEGHSGITATTRGRPRAAVKGWTLQRALDDPACYSVFAAEAQRLMCSEYTSFWNDYQAHRMPWTGRSTTPSQPPTSTSSQVAVHIEKGGSVGAPSAAVPSDAMEYHAWMYDKYVRTDSPFELNISDSVRRAYADALQGAGPHHSSTSSPTRSTAPIVTPKLMLPDERHQSSRSSPDGVYLPGTDRPVISGVCAAHRPSVVRIATTVGDRSSSLVFPITARELSSDARILRASISERNDGNVADGGPDVNARTELSVLTSTIVAEVLTLMETNIWPQVKQSPAFAQLLEERATE